MTQLALFNFNDNEDAYPLPVLVARRCDFPLQVQEIGDVDFYSVQDWIAGICQIATTEAAKRWANIQRERSKKETAPIGEVSKLRANGLIKAALYIAKDGKKYQRDYATHEAINTITQRINADTPLGDAMRAYLSKSGVKLDGYRLDPEKAVSDAIDSKAWDKDDSWKEARLLGIVTRKQLTDAIRDVVINVSPDFYRESTETVYRGLWNRTTAQLRGELGLTKNQNTRDSFGVYALIYTRLAEMVASERLREYDIVPMGLAAEIIYEVVKLIKVQADATSAALGRDLVTDKPLLTARTRK